MNDLHAIVISVDYSDILQISLPYNRRHFSSVTVVTSLADQKNVQPIADANDARVITTDLFTYGGAKFNKFLALEYGLNVMGRTGFIVNLDADVLWPKNAPLNLVKGNLYTPLRHMYPYIPVSADRIPPESEWGNYPIHRNLAEWAGYSQIFHADDPVLGSPPWHDVTWTHCGGGDSFFQAKWPAERKIRPPWNVLHLGEPGCNWLGRASVYADGSSPGDADAKRRELREMIGRRGRGEDRLKHEKYGDGISPAL